MIISPDSPTDPAFQELAFAEELEAKCDYEGALAKYSECKEILWPEVKEGFQKHSDEAIRAIVGQCVCEIALQFIHSDMGRRRFKDCQSYTAEMTRDLNVVAGLGHDHYNNAFYLNSLITGYKRLEKALVTQGWNSEAGGMYVGWRESSRLLSICQYKAYIKAKMRRAAIHEGSYALMQTCLKYSCGYGEKPVCWAITAIAPISIAGCILSHFQLLLDHGTGEAASLSVSIYFALITFLTVGYGDVTPHYFWGRVISVLIAMWGYLMFSLLVTMIARKIVR